MKKLFINISVGITLLFSSLQLASAVENKTWVYIVSNGDSLWNITAKYLTKIDYYTKLQNLNNIKYPKKIKPGSVIRIPMEWLKHTPASAEISFIQGENQFYRNQKLLSLTSEIDLVLGDEIHTGDTGSVTVIFADGSEMVLFKNTIVSFDHLSIYGKTGMVDTRVRVIKGKVETNAKKNKGPGSRLDISTPSAISSVRGTVYRVSNTGKNISTVEVIEGTVDVAGDKPNNAIKVQTGQGTRIEEGIAPTKPTPLLPAPTIATTQEYFEIAPKITWAAIDNAQFYNTQVSTQNDFKNIIWEKKTASTEVDLVNLNDGTYYYRVTATDQLGIEGLPAKNKITVNLLPAAPTLNNIPEMILGDASLSVLSWNNTADSYNVEIAKDKDFTQVLSTQTTTENQLSLPENLIFGQYFWRVTAINNLGNKIDKGPASSASTFNWKTVIDAPKCNVNASSESVDISWSAIQKDQTLQVQVAKNDDFTEQVKNYQFDYTSSHTQLEVNEETYVRCKITLNNFDIESQWGNTQHVSSLDKGIFASFGFLLLVILI